MSAWEAPLLAPHDSHHLCPQLLALFLRLCGQPLCLHTTHKVEWAYGSKRERGTLGPVLSQFFYP